MYSIWSKYILRLVKSIVGIEIELIKNFVGAFDLVDNTSTY